MNEHTLRRLARPLPNAPELQELDRLTNGKWVPLRIANPSKDFFPGDHLLENLDD